MEQHGQWRRQGHVARRRGPFDAKAWQLLMDALGLPVRFARMVPSRLRFRDDRHLSSGLDVATMDASTATGCEPQAP
jgi:hypothetical protein